jgi:anti-sigma factor RsiW
MMNPDPVYQKLREIGWRRPLTEAEQSELRAWLATHPEAQADAVDDAALSQALAKLPDAPLPSNFTARVLQAVERDAACAKRTAARRASPWWRIWIPRVAVTAVMVGVGLVVYQHNETVKREELANAAKDFVTVAGAAPLSDPTVLEDFEVIRRMSQADDGLLALSEDLMSLKP